MPPFDWTHVGTFFTAVGGFLAIVSMLGGAVFQLARMVSTLRQLKDSFEGFRNEVVTTHDDFRDELKTLHTRTTTLEVTLRERGQHWHGREVTHEHEGRAD